MIENEWRSNNCPADFGLLYCPCYFTPPVCEGAWNCDGMETNVEEWMAYYNNDGD